ncbi:hypothetical protein GCM10025864_39450 [Luteimicrobium album]|uniref:Uncharacterized protein n=1 Tax=Luteimicrobium album TaxID=1054550 RepID=A0ABQ6I626_9MICO|nr:hypothetical protein GCM10025864_39450 [Luteimicrobium album]
MTNHAQGWSSQQVRPGARSDIWPLGKAWTQLLGPSERGIPGRDPQLPLSKRVVHRWEFEDKRRFQVVDDEQSMIVADREAELWEWAWRTPQAAAWAREPWRWQTVAMWVRTFVVCEGDEATAADKGSVHRFADQIGLTPAGLKENGWAIAAAQIEPVTAVEDGVTERPAPVRRLRA